MSATGHEDEFRLLFAQEADERLGNLSRQLLELEQAASDPELVASIFREAHTLKGAAAVVGLEEVGVVAHAMEDLLEQLRAGERLATPALIDTVLAAVDGLQEMLPGVLAGENRMAAARKLEAQLRQLSESGHQLPGPEEDAAASTGGEEEPGDDAAASADGQEEPGGKEPAPDAMVGDARARTRRAQALIDAETVRVPLARLDELVRLVGE